MLRVAVARNRGNDEIKQLRKALRASTVPAQDRVYHRTRIRFGPFFWLVVNRPETGRVCVFTLGGRRGVWICARSWYDRWL